MHNSLNILYIIYLQLQDRLGVSRYFPVLVFVLINKIFRITGSIKSWARLDGNICWGSDLLWTTLFWQVMNSYWQSLRARQYFYCVQEHSYHLHKTIMDNECLTKYLLQESLDNDNARIPDNSCYLLYSIIINNKHLIRISCKTGILWCKDITLYCFS